MYRVLLHFYRALLDLTTTITTTPFPGIYRALLDCVLDVYRALLIVYRALVDVYKVLLGVLEALLDIQGALLLCIGLSKMFTGLL